MDNFIHQNLSHDAIHGYIPFVAPQPGDDRETCERHLIDNPWVQRMRQIHQLQTAWWVFPTAEHTRFQHILGVMHLASKAVARLYPSLKSIDASTPTLPYVDSLMRMAGLLHDIGHGPFGHFFDAHFLAHYGLNHEVLGAYIIEHAVGKQLAKIRRSPMGELAPDETLSAEDIAWLIQRPKHSDKDLRPPWLHFLRSLFCGIYTVDNMDFVLRDAFMTGLNPRAFDLQRILHYSYFSQRGLTIHDRGMPALVHFLSMKAELFRNVYFHRTVRAIDLELAELFRDSFQFILPGNPLDNLDAYHELTEFALLTDVRRWKQSRDPKLMQLGLRWNDLLDRKIKWTMVCQRNLSFGVDQVEASSIFSNNRLFAQSIRDRLPKGLETLPFQVDLARHIHRPHTFGATAGMNFYQDSSSDQIRPLTTHGLYKHLPISHTIARVYAQDAQHAQLLCNIVDAIVGQPSEDDATNM